MITAMTELEFMKFLTSSKRGDEVVYYYGFTPKMENPAPIMQAAGRAAKAGMVSLVQRCTTPAEANGRRDRLTVQQFEYIAQRRR